MKSCMETHIVHFIIISYILLTAWVLVLSHSRNIRFCKILLICVFLTPIIGLITLAISTPKITITHEKFGSSVEDAD